MRAEQILPVGGSEVQRGRPSVGYPSGCKKVLREWEKKMRECIHTNTRSRDDGLLGYEVIC